MTTQLDLFGEARVKVEEPEPMTAVRVGSRTVQIPLRRKRRDALNRLMEVLAELEGKDIYIGSYEAGGQHFWIDNLKLGRLQLEYFPHHFLNKEDYIPTVIVLRGNRGGHVRIFTDYLVAVRTQEYQGYWHWLLDFRNGLWQHPIDNFRSHCACLTMTKFKD